MPDMPQPAQAGKYYRLRGLRFEHQPNGKWGVSDGMRGVCNLHTPIGAYLAWRRFRNSDAPSRAHAECPSCQCWRLEDGDPITLSFDGDTVAHARISVTQVDGRVVLTLTDAELITTEPDAPGDDR